jgi:hypothetical protein
VKVAQSRKRSGAWRWRCELCKTDGTAPDEAEALAGFEDHYARSHREN